jgi:hypothetical protein
MPHPSDNIGVDLNNYLAALDKYNLAYGPQPQGTGGTVGQNFAVRSSTEAPGFGYVNPETNALFPLYPEGTEPQGPPQGGGFSGGEGRFHDYLQSIGAKQQDIGYGDMFSPKLTRRFDNEQGTMLYGLPGGGLFSEYDLSRGRGPNAPYELGEHVLSGVDKSPAPGSSGSYSIGARPGYVDPKGGFLGYGETPDELFSNSSPLLQRQYYESLIR